MTVRRIPFLAAVLIAAIGELLGARAGEPRRAGDGATVEACLRLTQKNRDARGTHEPDELTEKTGPEGHLGAARDGAVSESESCVGIVATTCIQAEGNMSTPVLVDCYGRERDVWDARLNAAYRKLMASGEDDDVTEGFRKVQRAWIAFRDASCGQPSLFFKGTMAAPIAAYCTMKMTAQQALWLEGYLP